MAASPSIFHRKVCYIWLPSVGGFLDWTWPLGKQVNYEDATFHEAYRRHFLCFSELFSFVCRFISVVKSADGAVITRYQGIVDKKQIP